MNAFRELPYRLSLPVNVGFIAQLSDWSPALVERLVDASSQGILGVFATSLPHEADRYLQSFQLPRIEASVLPAVADEIVSLADCASQTHHCARQLRLPDRGTICLGAIADLALHRSIDSQEATATLDAYDLHQVIVGGNVVFNDGRVTDATPGVLLSGSCC